MVSSPITHKNAQKIIRRALCMTGCSLSLLLSQVSVYSTPVFANPVQASSKATEAAIEDEKPIYSIAERLIRANGLDDYTWRIKVEDEYDDNASARDVNQVILLKGLMDKIYGDDAALAFVISHEIAHHTQRHISKQTTLVSLLKKQLEAEADAEIQNLITTETRKFNRKKRRGKPLCTPENIAKTPSLSASSEYLVLNCQGKPDADKIEQMKQQIIEGKVQKFLSEAKKLSRQQEFEADAFGYIYMVKAGYDPEGALRVLNLMSRLPGADSEDSTHPSFSDRINAIKELMKKYPASSLAAEGAIRLRQNPKPLTYGISKDGESLRINSRFSSQQNGSKPNN